MRVYTRFGEKEFQNSWDTSPRQRLHLVLGALSGSTSLLEGHIAPERYQAGDEVSIVRLPQFRRAAEDGFLSEMAFLATAWINSGKSKDGIDTVQDRHVGELPGMDYTLAQRLIGSLTNVNFGVPDALTMTGRTPQGSDVQFFYFDSSRALGTYDNQGRTFGKIVAAYWFRRLLDSDFSRHFSKCDYCGNFFECKRITLKPIYHGVFCDEHKLKGSRQRSDASRKNQAQQIIETAAAVWNDCPKSRIAGREVWVAERVSKTLGIELKRNTITHHKAEILEQVKRSAES